jgi:hypothetical protein
MTTIFTDALDYCDVHGHEPERVREYIIDIVGNIILEDKCKKCGKIRETMKPHNDLRMSETYYPDGQWK